MRDGYGLAPIRLFLSLSLLILLASCSSGGDGGPATPPDPGDALAVTNLAAVSGSPGSVTLGWTVPATVKADWTMRYDLRYLPLGEESVPWSAWTLTDEPATANTPGAAATHTVTGLEADGTYVFKLRCSTDGETWSEVSNAVVATAADVLDVTAPGQLTTLAFWSSTGSSVTLVWSPGADDAGYGSASGYQVRYATSAVNDATWETATVSGAPIVAAANPDLLQTTITGLQSGQDYYFAVKVLDDMDHMSTTSNQIMARTEARRTFYIKADGTGDYRTIEEGIYAAGTGDRILVAAGRYTWSSQGNGDVEHGMIWIQRDMTGWDLVSESGPEATILDAEQEAAVIFIQGYNEITIEGFTITGGVALEDPLDPAGRNVGGGITSHLNDARIVNCIITGNEAFQGGGVWHGGVGEFTLIDCVIKGNQAEVGGGVVLVNSYDRIVLRNCDIRGNTASVSGGGVFAFNVVTTLEGCVVTDNTAGDRGGALYLGGLNEDCRLENCTIVANQAPVASALRLSGRDDIHPGDPFFLADVRNCVIAFNTDGAAMETINEGGLGNVGCNLVFGNAGGNDWPTVYTDVGGNLNLDPDFCSLATLAPGPTSPCLPANHPDGGGCGLIGAVPVGTCQ